MQKKNKVIVDIFSIYLGYTVHYCLIMCISEAEDGRKKNLTLYGFININASDLFFCTHYVYSIMVNATK